MTGAQASAVAKSIVPRDQADAEWLEDMAILLAAAADRRGVFLRPLPNETAAESDGPTEDGHGAQSARCFDRPLLGQAPFGEARAPADAAVVAEAMAIATTAQAAVAAEREESAASAAQTARDAVASAAERAMDAAEVARSAQSVAVETAAQSVAEIAATTAAEVQRRADLSALAVAGDASRAALEMAEAFPASGGGRAHRFTDGSDGVSDCGQRGSRDG